MDTFTLTRFIDSYYGKVFSWGTNDCSVFIKDYLEQLTGNNLSSVVSYCWRDKVEAVAYLRSLDNDFISTVCSSVNCIEVKLSSEGKLGDISFIDFGGWVTAGIEYHSDRVAMFIEGSGLKLVDKRVCKIIKTIRVIK